MVDVVQTQSPERPPIDAVLEGAEYAPEEKPIRLRVQPSIYNHEKMQHDSWPQLVFQFEVQDVAAAARFRQALTLYFKLFGEMGSEAMLAKLAELEAQP